MRAAVFNRYWPTGGGAEKFGGVIAELLSKEYDTDVLGFDPVDLSWLSERLRIDLSRTRWRCVEDRPTAVTDASADYDLFVNVSFLSSDPAASRRSLYVVHFPAKPDGHLSAAQRLVVKHLGSARSSAAVGMSWGTGFHHRGGGRRAPMWTDGDGILYVSSPVGSRLPVELIMGHHRPPTLGDTRVHVDVDGAEVASTIVRTPRSRVQARRPAAFRFVLPAASTEPLEMHIRSDTFVPAEVLGTDDERRLGVPLLGIRLGGGLVARLGRWFPILLTPPPSLDWLDSYGSLVANSEFTRGWVTRWWGHDAQVLHPPVTMQEGSAKQPVILNVGRFFAADRGHSKKQLELVQAFRALCDGGVRGWSLHLVGGCAQADRPYLDEVEAAAAGYPVELHVNASGAELADLYGTASIYWHASGLGEDATRRPDRLEHFGITTVEAMSAGVVPVVIGLAGQLETVRHGVDGFHFHTLEGLVAQTRQLIGDARLRQQMSESAADRARDFSIEAFAERLDQIVGVVA